MKYPHAKQLLLPENRTQRRIVPTQIIVHTAVDSKAATSLYPFFSRADVGAESHFFVNNTGGVEQYMDTEVMANANRFADTRAISIETEDDGDPEGNPWTGAQSLALVHLIDWLCRAHGIPRVRVPVWDQPGIGWHSMWSFREPEDLKGMLPTSPWTIFRGKTCPGKTRIRQFLDLILPSVQTLGYPPLAGGDDMLFVEATGSPSHPSNPCFLVIGGCWHHISSSEAYQWYANQWGDRLETVRFEDLDRLKRVEGLPI